VKRVTLAEVAERAGVSVMTASYTYNRPERVSDRSRSKVLAAAARAPDEQDQEIGRDGDDGKMRRRAVQLGEMRHARSITGCGQAFGKVRSSDRGRVCQTSTRPCSSA